MKTKLLLTICILFSAVSFMSAQTYCYKHISSIDEKTEIRSAGTGEIIYITFVKNGEICYRSDKNGNSKDSLGMILKNNSNGILTYVQNTGYSMMSFMTYKFSSDLSRFNNFVGGIVGVYERVTNPTDAVTPDKLY